MAPQFVPGVLVEIRDAKGVTSWFEFTVRDDRDSVHAILASWKAQGITLTGNRRVKERPERVTGARGFGYARRAAYLRA